MNPINVGDPITWHTHNQSHLHGNITHIRQGFYIAQTQHGIRYALRARDIAKEEPCATSTPTNTQTQP